MTFKFTPKQEAATELIAGPARHIMLEGGSRSAKTFEACWAIVLRGLMAPGSRHAILRFRFNHVITSVWYDTFPKMMKLAFPNVKYEENKSNWFIKLPGGSEIWFGGLDDKDRTEKILGNEYCTIFFNECSQMQYGAVETALTRLAQKVEFIQEGQPRTMRLKALYDQNPPSKGHWTYKLFHRSLSPVTSLGISNPANYAHILMNPMDNKANIAPEYIEEMQNTSDRQQRRFLRGEYSDENPNALFPEETIDKCRVMDGKTPEFVRVVVAVDPSGASDDETKNNDAIGNIVAGLGTDGIAYILEDLTVKAGPATWGRVAVSAYDRRQASIIVAEKNFGGEMVKSTIQTAATAYGIEMPSFKFVSASRGKIVRAEPIAALYEVGKVRHVGHFRELEDELSGFSTHGYTGPRSPNRADALVWALTELFPGIVKQEQEVGRERIINPFAFQIG